MSQAIHDAFMQAIIESPGDDAPRLIYADWLETEGGEPDRAEFIKVQVELAKWKDGATNDYYYMHLDDDKAVAAMCDCTTCALVRRDRAPLNAKTKWLPQFIKKTRAEVVFRRGFIAEIKCSCRTWLENGRQLVVENPIEKLTLTDHSSDRAYPWQYFIGSKSAFNMTALKWAQCGGYLLPRPKIGMYYE